MWSTDVPFSGPPVPAITFSVSPTTVAAGGAATLTWATTNATSATIDQGIGVVSVAGSRVVNPTTTTTYTLTSSSTACSGAR